MKINWACCVFVIWAILLMTGIYLTPKIMRDGEPWTIQCNSSVSEYSYIDEGGNRFPVAFKTREEAEKAMFHEKHSHDWKKCP